jgi:hypothetical protein
VIITALSAATTTPAYTSAVPVFSNESNFPSSTCLVCSSLKTLEMAASSIFKEG